MKELLYSWPELATTPPPHGPTMDLALVCAVVGAAGVVVPFLSACMDWELHGPFTTYSPERLKVYRIGVPIWIALAISEFWVPVLMGLLVMVGTLSMIGILLLKMASNLAVALWPKETVKAVVTGVLRARDRSLSPAAKPTATSDRSLSRPWKGQNQ